MEVGDLVVNTYLHASLHGKVGIVVGIEKRFGDVLVSYGDQTARLTRNCLEVISESR